MESDIIVTTATCIATSLSAAVRALHHTSILRAPLLPHYRHKYILEQIGVLTLPYVPSTAAQRQIDAKIASFRIELRPPSAFLLLSGNASRFERLTRFSVVEFLILYHELEANIRRPYLIYRQPAEGERTRRLHPVDQLLLWLWHSDGSDPDVLGILFNDISRNTADRVADHITRAVIDTWAAEVSWPDAEERRSLYGFFSSYDRAVGVMDGTHCQIEVPIVEEGQYHSYYKNYHTQNYLICADALGFVIYTAGPFGGRDNDRGVFNTTPFVQRTCPLLSDGEVILVDGGFAGEGHILHQFTERELMQLTKEERERIACFNEDFTHNRSPIEHCIHRVKNRAQALARRWPRALQRQAELFTAATLVYNRCRRMRMEHALLNRSASS
jgi:DDE superfamily endonuclease